jgi:hypothetical protein
VPRFAIFLACIPMFFGTGCSWLFPDPPSIGGDLPDGFSRPDIPSGDLPDGFEPGDVQGRDDGGTFDARDGVAPRDTGCTPDCFVRVCGPDGCGGSCGTCPPQTACSSDQTRCLFVEAQQPFGGHCGQTEDCAPTRVDPFTPGGTYVNYDWPRCLNDQCRDGQCRFGVCTRSCKVTKDTVENGTGLPGPDGIEDGDASTTECAGAVSGPYSDEFACVEVEDLAEAGTRGICLPRSSFRPCGSPFECPGDEGCGYLQVRNNLEARCLASPPGARGIGSTCGYDPGTGLTVRCDAWNCSEFGCTNACGAAADCVTIGARCDSSTGKCETSGHPCEGDSDCSAWTCGSDTRILEPAGLFVACGPRVCTRDGDCLDPGFHCRHRPVWFQGSEAGWVGRCERDTAGGGGLGESCDVSPGDGVPDRVCGNGSYCLDRRCSSLCVDHGDCGDSGNMLCVRRDTPVDVNLDGKVDGVLALPACAWLGTTGGGSCSSGSDCGAGQACTPFVLDGEAGSMKVRLACAEPPDDALPAGSLCGRAAGGATCDTRICLDENAALGVPGFCSSVCVDDGDCPGETGLGSMRVRWICESRPFARSGTLDRSDDLHVSWCVPVPATSSLNPCPSGICDDPGEACRPTVRTGAPEMIDQTRLMCVRPETGAPLGGMCNPLLGGVDCASGLCEPTFAQGLGFCSRPCLSDFDCGTLGGGGAVCAPRTLVPRSGPLPGIELPVCRLLGECVTCQSRWDCDANHRCVDVSQVTYATNYRCAPACQDNQDCAGFGDGFECIEANTTWASSTTGKTQACLPLTCGP